ncbi:MAG: hypothetical protein AB8B36_12985 [Prochlorococcus sp.]
MLLSKLEQQEHRIAHLPGKQSEADLHEHQRGNGQWSGVHPPGLALQRRDVRQWQPTAPD